MNVIYDVFRTGWGFFGIAATPGGICRTCLPLESQKAAKEFICDGFSDALRDESAFSGLKTRILSYFDGNEADFGRLSFDLGGFSPFTQAVLKQCAKISAGSTLTYSELAALIRHPHAARAVGSALAANPIPLLIPCHRVLRTDGQMGGFSAPGGIAVKRRLLQLEQGLVSENHQSALSFSRT